MNCKKRASTLDLIASRRNFETASSETREVERSPFCYTFPAMKPLNTLIRVSVRTGFMRQQAAFNFRLDERGMSWLTADAESRFMQDLYQRARQIRLAVFDVDGVLTDGALSFGIPAKS